MLERVGQAILAMSDAERVAITALFGIVLSAILSTTVASVVSRRSIYISSVTAERSKWIEKLRSNISEIAGLCSYMNLKQLVRPGFEKSDEYDEVFKKADTLCSLVRLQLNPKGKIDANTIEILNLIIRVSATRDPVDAYQVQQLLILHSQWLLKEEWETVKTEAAGWIRGVGFRWKRRKRAEAYRLFCSAEGSLAVLN